MDRNKFEEIYVNYGERRYPIETVRSVQNCYIANEQRELAIKAASEKVRLTKQDAIADVLDFFNCLKRCYSGYDYFFTDEMCDRIQKKIIRQIKIWPGKISNRRLQFYIFRELASIINDCHFELYVCNQTRFLRKQYVAYVADIVLCKEKDGYQIVKGNSDFTQGQLLSEEEVKNYLMPTIYLGENSGLDKAYYLLGIYSDKKVKVISLGRKRLKLHRILSDRAGQSEESRVVPDKGYVKVNHHTYDMPWDEDLLQEYYEEGCLCSKEDAVILNLTGNGGGCSFYPKRFFDGLNGNGENGFIEAHLPEPSNICNEVKKYELNYPNTSESSSYMGAVYVVMNKATASSAEMGVSSASFVKNVVCLGSGSLGCGTFGQCVMFQLQKSKIIFCFGHKSFYHDGFEEGKGFLPDYWIDDENPVEVVEKWIRGKMVDIHLGQC